MAPATSVSISFKEEPLHTPREKMVQTERTEDEKIEKKKTSTFVHVTEQGPRATLKPGPRTLGVETRADLKVLRQKRAKYRLC